MKRLFPALVMACACASQTLAVQFTASNPSYFVVTGTGAGTNDFTITLSGSSGISQTLKPQFTVLFTGTKNPGYNENHDNYPLAPRTAILWTNCSMPIDDLNTMLAQPAWQTMMGGTCIVTSSTVAAGISRTWNYQFSATKTYTVSGTNSNGTLNLYSQGTTLPLKTMDTPIVMSATNTTVQEVATNFTFHWTFPTNPAFTLTAEMILPKSGGDPRITYHLVAKQEGYFSVGFTGAPTIASGSTSTVPQVALGTNNNLSNFVMCEADLTLPAILLQSSGSAAVPWSAALVVDPSDSEFLDDAGVPRVLDRTHSRFGMMIQRSMDASDTVQLMSFAPLLGGPESYLTVNQAYDFHLRYALQATGWPQLQAYLATNLYGLGDKRDNTGTGSMNGTIERLMAFLSDKNGKNYAMWDPQQKYFDYYCDYPGAFKPFSPLYGLSAAVITDDENFYTTRALPQVQFAISRRTNAWLTYAVEDTGQLSTPSNSLDPDKALGAPFIGAVQICGLHEFFGRAAVTGTNNRTSVFQLFTGSSAAHPYVKFSDAADYLAKYNMTNDPADLTKAIQLADQKAVSDPTYYRYQDWLDLYEASPKQTYLDAIKLGVYGFVSHNVVLSPPIPSGNVTVDIGGEAPLHVQAGGRNRRWGFPKAIGFPAPEQTVPAWRPALNGLPTEGYRGEFWMDDYGHLVRIAQLLRTDTLGDDYLKNIAHLGMVGRFANYPGDNRLVPSLVIEQPQLPENPMWMETHATVNPCHAWDIVAETLDFLISDFYYLSNGGINFPSRSTKGAVYRMRIYGDRPGNFYTDTGVWLWMPAGLLSINNPQIDYLSGYQPRTTPTGKDTLYLAFTNRSPTTQTFTATISPDCVNGATTFSGTAKRRVANGNPGNFSFNNGTLTVSIGARSIVTFALPGADLSRKLQAKMMDTSQPAFSGSNSYVQANIPYPGGSQFLTFKGKNGALIEDRKVTVYGMVISLGKGLSSAFIYSDAPPGDVITTETTSQPVKVISAKVSYRQGSTGSFTDTEGDNIYPYEFTIPYHEDQGPLEFYYKVTVPAPGGTTAELTTSSLTLAP